MATKSVSPTKHIVATLTDLMEESRKFKENLEIQKHQHNKDPIISIYSETASRTPPHSQPATQTTLQVPQLQKMPTDQDVQLLEGTMQRNPKLGVSRSQDDNKEVEMEEQSYGRVTPISYASAIAGMAPPQPSSSSSGRSSGLSSVGASRATNFRMKFRKSHTCGSLFAKCNCAEVTATPTPTVVRPGPNPIITGQITNSRAISIDKNLNASATATATTTTATIHNYQQQQCMHLSISPSSCNAESSLASSLSDTAGTSGKLTSSGIYSLSTQTSSATSAYLSREESLTASFDTHLLSPSGTTSAAAGEMADPSKSSANATTLTNNSTTLAKQAISPDTELASLARSKGQAIPRISSPPAVGIEYSASSSSRSSPLTVVSRKSDAVQKSKKLFQSYSHPDTDFIFTDENKHPSRESLQHLLSPQQQSQETVITSRGGRVEIKQPKRSSSPNIGHFQVLDVAVHPDILVKISPKHSPLCEPRRPHESPLAARSTQQRRRLLQRSHEIDSGGSTSESEKSVEVKSPTDLKSPLSTRTQVASPLLTTKRLPLQASVSSSASDDSNFNAAQKYFAESGILGPVPSSATNLIRKTSKILQDSNVIEQIRKTSMILRSNTSGNTGTTNQPTAINASVMPKTNNNNSSQNTNNGATNYNNTVSSTNLTLKLQSNVTCGGSGVISGTASSSTAAQYQPGLIYSPPSPQSPHTMATKCGFSPNVTTQSCSVIDDKDAQIKSLQGEIVSLKDVIKSRDAEIVKLRREIHKLK
ncbi:serine-rich adhesin for platelets-like, partial [Musca vetustissima]|uniref:serine-rich adhesin for platelets-like n=1 Tax=Musca vetustissima TaxID=27455 RepID=UPI002AB61707